MPPSNRNNFALPNWLLSKQTASLGIAFSYFGFIERYDEAFRLVTFVLFIVSIFS
jgi:hypothetical protein